MAKILSDIMTRHVDCVTPTSTLSEAAALMTGSRISSVLVMEQGKLVGIITERDIVKVMNANLPGDKPVAEVMSRNVLTVNPALDINTAFRFASHNGVRHLAVADTQGYPVGVVSDSDFRFHLGVSFFAHLRDVASLMSDACLRLPPDTPLERGMSLMAKSRASCITVVEDEKPLGIITERDVVRLFRDGVEGVLVRDVMVSPVHTIRSDAALTLAAAQMQAFSVRHLVVVDADDRLVGMLSEHDLVRPLEREDETLIRLANSEGRERLHQLMGSIPDMVFFKDANGIFVEANQALAEYFNAPAEALIGKTDADFLDEQAAAHFSHSDQDVAASGKMARGERWLNYSDGRRVLMDVIKTPVYNVDGHYTGIFCIARDITERHLLEKELKRRTDYQQALLDNFPFLVWLKDTQGRLLSVNQTYADAAGLPDVDSLIGKTDLDVWPQDLAERYFADDAEVMASRQQKNIEELIEECGQRVWFETYKAPVLDTQGEVLGTVGFARDITKRKQFEQQLRLAASVFQYAHDGIYITDQKGVILDVNSAFEEITGFQRSEVLGQSPRLFKSGHHPPEFYQEMWKTLLESGCWSGEIWNRRKDGELVAELLTISAVSHEKIVTHYVAVFSDITALKRSQSQMERLAYYDALTQLPNRALFSDRFKVALAQAERSSELLGVCYLDLDGFKPVNDHFGHAMGDLLLKEVAVRMGNCVRAGDTVSRLGGDEFALLLTGIRSLAECEQTMTRILTTLSHPFVVEGNNIAISASMGYTLFPYDQGDADTLLRHADQAMYAAKQAGRDRFSRFDAELDMRVSAQMEALSRVETGLEKGEFHLLYQPKVDMRRGLVMGVEALIRWQHPERGLLLPAEFLPLVEQTDFAVTLGSWVLEQTMMQVAAWAKDGVILPVSVNISPRHLQSPSFAQELAALFARHPQLPPKMLELEILETTAFEDVARVSSIIRECAEMGVTFALDDFGTGYSSLIYLRHLPAQVLKIDQTFIRDMVHDMESFAIVESVIGLSAAFKRRVIAEGVELQEQAELLKQLGCDVVQGFGIAEPMPAEQIKEWVAHWKPELCCRRADQSGG
ncbi:MAG: EAL domain-containing protein [Nitrosomonadales bacterium]|nr:EAL domain-containing protein [Nitrosomonadales bacterium]